MTSAEDIDPEFILKQLEELDNVQATLEQLDDKASEEIMAIESKYLKLKRPMFRHRQALIKTIPNFWGSVLQNHDNLRDLFTPIDKDILRFLELLDIEHLQDMRSGFKLVLAFSANPYFNNATLTKEFCFGEDDELEVAYSKIRWKDAATPDDSIDSFFVTYFSDGDTTLEVAEIIKDSIWPNPVIFLGDT